MKGVAEFRKDIGWVKQDSIGVYQMTEIGRMKGHASKLIFGYDFIHNLSCLARRNPI